MSKPFKVQSMKEQKMLICNNLKIILSFEKHNYMNFQTNHQNMFNL